MSRSSDSPGAVPPLARGRMAGSAATYRVTKDTSYLFQRFKTAFSACAIPTSPIPSIRNKAMAVLGREKCNGSRAV